MKAHQAEHPVQTQGRVLGLSVSGYYASQTRAPSARSLQDAWLLERIQASHGASKGTYGARCVHADLQAEGLQVGRERVERLMRQAGLEGVSQRKWVTTTVRSEQQLGAPDLVNRRFAADAPNRLWVADITYVPTWEGFLYLAVVLGVFSRRVVGWSMSTSLATPLVLTAIEMAVRQRQPSRTVHHSDHDCQYTSTAYGQRSTDAGLMPSMGTVGDAYDNAVMESFFSTPECEVIAPGSLRTRDQAHREAFSFLEGWYNPRRRHSAPGSKSPAQFEALAASTATQSLSSCPSTKARAPQVTSLGVRALGQGVQNVVADSSTEWLGRQHGERADPFAEIYGGTGATDCASPTWRRCTR